MKKILHIAVHQNPGNRNTATLTAGALRFQCAIGRSGIRPQATKVEGDGATPGGRFRPLRVFYRRDHVSRPVTTVPTIPVRTYFGWCDQPGSGQYNRLVRLPHPYGCEGMWRQDHLYDIVIEISHNARPRIQGKGSAVFIHIATTDLLPTQGCVALRRQELLRLLGVMSPETVIQFG